MSKQKIETPPFPIIRPEITITPTDEPVFDVDLREMTWWFAIPEIGDHTSWAMYDPPEWQLICWYDMQTVRPAIIHGIEGVEIDTTEHEIVDNEEHINPSKHFVRLAEDTVQNLAVLSLEGDKRRLYTLLDERFDENWGRGARRIRQSGRFKQQSDGSLDQIAEYLVPGETTEAMDVCKVTIGDRSFSCLRVLSLDHTFNENSVMIEAYLSRESRTLLCRRYNGIQWNRGPGSAYADKPPWDERFPDHNRIVIDGVTFVHWYDDLSDRAVGIDTGALPAIG
jgi:hypothetical protein